MSTGWDADYSDYCYQPAPLFEGTFRCAPLENDKNPSFETGNKIIMPQSSFDQLLNLPIQYPMTFKVEGFRSDKVSHCGVLEFCAEEGFVYMPRWMMMNLNVEEGDDVLLRDAPKLPTGTYMKLQPHAAAFLELPNPKAVLEMSLRGFSCLTSGDTFLVKYEGKDFYLDVLEVKPDGRGVSLIDTDCILEFAPPLDYHEEEVKEEETVEKVDQGSELAEEMKMFRPFMGAARRIDGKAVKVESSGCDCSSAVVKREKEEKKETAVKRSEKEEKKDTETNKFQPFTGRSRVTGI